MGAGAASPSHDAAKAPACRMCGDPDLQPAGRVRGYAFLECPSCAFTFTPQVTPESMASAYAEGWRGVEEGAPEEGWAKGVRFLEPALAFLREAHPLRILDFGTGQSFVPDALRREGHRVVAVDVAPPLRPHPDRLTGDILALDLPRGGFDLVYSYQVFEHLPEPRPALERLLDLARPGGAVLVHTDMEMPEREAGLEKWWYVLPPDHCAFFRHRTFERFLEEQPHRLVFKDAKRVLIQRAGA